MERKLVVTALSAVLGLGLVACDKKQQATPKTETVGVAACDEWLQKYTRCIHDKVPESVRGQLQESMKRSADTWKQMASTPEGKAGLEDACKQVLEVTKKMTASFHCEW